MQARPGSGVLFVTWDGVVNGSHSTLRTSQSVYETVLEWRIQLRSEGHEDEARRMTRVLTMLRHKAYRAKSFAELSLLHSSDWEEVRNYGEITHELFRRLVLEKVGIELAPWPQSERKNENYFYP